MNRDLLKDKFNELVSKSGMVGQFVLGFVKDLSIPLSSGDVEAIRARAVEAKEFAAELDSFADDLIEAVADGVLTVEEGADLANELMALIDEAEDIGTGVDEDDPPAEG